MPEPATIAAGLSILNSVKSLFGGGGSKPDKGLQKIQRQIAQALLGQMTQQQAVTGPFQQKLAMAIGNRTRQPLPIQSLNVPNIAPALANATPTTRTIDPASFLGQKAARPAPVNNQA